MAHISSKLPACANCDFTFPPEGPDEFCPRCGQQNHEVDIGFHHVVEETLEGLFHFDGKVFRTMRLLLFRPGVLTRRFLSGHRVPYVPPIRLYVFLSFVFFLLLSTFGISRHGHERGSRWLSEQFKEDIKQDTEQRVAKAPPAQRDSLRRLLTDSLEQRLRKGRNLGLASVFNTDSTARKKSRSPQRERGIHVNSPDLELGPTEIAKLPADPSEAQIDSIVRSKGAVPGFWNRLTIKRAIRWRDATVEDAIHQGLRGLSVVAFLLMPLATLLLKGVYFRQHRHYVSHLIFSVHVHCFLFVYFGVYILLSKLSFMKWADDYVLLIPAVYFVLALRNFYQQGWGKTLLKSGLLGVSYSLTLAFALILVFLAGLALF